MNWNIHIYFLIYDFMTYLFLEIIYLKKMGKKESVGFGLVFFSIYFIYYMLYIYFFL